MFVLGQSNSDPISFTSARLKRITRVTHGNEQDENDCAFIGLAARHRLRYRKRSQRMQNLLRGAETTPRSHHGHGQTNRGRAFIVISWTLAGHMFMIVVDAHTKWPEAIDMGSNTQAGKIVIEFRKLFARFGLPRHVVTDNGRQYTSSEFREFLAHHGIRQTFTAPYHPVTIGPAENFVGTFKDKVTKIMKGSRWNTRSINFCLTIAARSIALLSVAQRGLCLKENSVPVLICLNLV
jgi:transposase InsO family protein